MTSFTVHLRITHEQAHTFLWIYTVCQRFVSRFPFDGTGLPYAVCNDRTKVLTFIPILRVCSVRTVLPGKSNKCTGMQKLSCIIACLTAHPQLSIRPDVIVSRTLPSWRCSNERIVTMESMRENQLRNSPRQDALCIRTRPKQPVAE